MKEAHEKTGDSADTINAWVWSVNPNHKGGRIP